MLLLVVRESELLVVSEVESAADGVEVELVPPVAGLAPLSAVVVAGVDDAVSAPTPLSVDVGVNVEVYVGGVEVELAPSVAGLVPLSAEVLLEVVGVDEAVVVGVVFEVAFVSDAFVPLVILVVSVFAGASLPGCNVSAEFDILKFLIARAIHENCIASGAGFASKIENPSPDLLVTTKSVPPARMLSDSTGVVEAFRVTEAEMTGASLYALSNFTSTCLEPFSIIATPPVSELKYGLPMNSTSLSRAMRSPIAPM